MVDATCDADLDVVAAAGYRVAMLTGGAGLARALATADAPSGATVDVGEPVGLPGGPGIVLAGSCSAATLAQVDAARAVFPSHRLDPSATPDAADLLGTALDWLAGNVGRGPVLLYSSAPAAQQIPGSAAMLEETLGTLARAAVVAGVRRVVVAGGETSGAVVSALGVTSVLVTAEEDRGVPWCVTTGNPALGLLLKSGNFGAPDLLVRAMRGTGEWEF